MDSQYPVVKGLSYVPCDESGAQAPLAVTGPGDG